MENLPVFLFVYVDAPVVRIHGIRTYNRPPKPTGCQFSE